MHYPTDVRISEYPIYKLLLSLDLYEARQISSSTKKKCIKNVSHFYADYYAMARYVPMVKTLHKWAVINVNTRIDECYIL